MERARGGVKAEDERIEADDLVHADDAVLNRRQSRRSEEVQMPRRCARHRRIRAEIKQVQENTGERDLIQRKVARIRRGT